MTNAINPSHYKSDTIECIDAMKACSTPEEFRGHLKLTVLKYLWREDKKGEGDQARVENLEKAAWYLERLVKDLRGEDTDAKIKAVFERIERTIPINVATSDDGLSGETFNIKLDVNGKISGFETGDGAFILASGPETVPPHTINAADQGWIEWRGGDCPVNSNAWVEVDYGNGPRRDVARNFWWDWTINGKPGDITRYRVVK